MQRVELYEYHFAHAILECPNKECCADLWLQDCCIDKGANELEYDLRTGTEKVEIECECPECHTKFKSTVTTRLEYEVEDTEIEGPQEV